MAGILQHLRSSTLDKRPNPASMVDGQVAINYASGAPGMFFKNSNGDLVKVGPVHVGSGAPNASPASGGTAGNSIGEQWLDNSGGTYVFKIWDGSAWRSEVGEFVNAAGDTMTGDLVMDDANIVFEGSTDDGFETTLTVTDPTADRTITLPNVTGTVVTTGDTGSVTSTMIADGTIVDADINASAAIADTKLATISTAGKVSNSATTATDANTASAIVARDGSGDFSAGTITADLTGNADTATALSTNRTFAVTGDVTGTVSSDLTSGASIATSIASGVIIDADINASAAIAGTKIDPDFGSQTIGTTGVVNAGSGTAGAPSVSVGTRDNGLYSPGADQVAISTSGVERLKFTSDGNVEFNTTYTDPQIATLSLRPGFLASATGGVGLGCVNHAGSANDGLGVYGHDGVSLHTAATEKLRITSGGELKHLGGGSEGSPAVYFAGSAPSNSLYVQAATGNLGVGTSSPAQLLHLKSAGDTKLLLNSTNNASDRGIYFAASTDSEVLGYIKQEYSTGKFEISSGSGTYSSNISFRTGGTADRVVIDSSGRLGVGTTSPVALLQVGAGNLSIPSAKSVFNTADTANAAIMVSNWTGSATTNGPRIYFDNSGRGRFDIGGGDGVHSFVIRDNEASSDRLTIDSSGRLLVGTSNALTVGDAQHLLQVESVSSVPHGGSFVRHGGTVAAAGAVITIGRSRGTSAGAVNAVNNNDTLGYIVFSGSNGTDFSNNAAWIKAEVDGDPFTSGDSTDLPGRLVFSTTADGASSPTERMRITNDGISRFVGSSLNIEISPIAGSIYRTTASTGGIAFSTTSILPTDNSGQVNDNTNSLGNSSYRWSVVYAGTGTINTSDANLKQDVELLDAAELKVAAAIKASIKKFRFIDAVKAKGDEARLHVGVIAQEIEQFFITEGLDPRRYGLFCEDTLNDGSKRLGIRYDELLAFVIAAL